jgi:thiamine-monophosphate kinase
VVIRHVCGGLFPQGDEEAEANKAEEVWPMLVKEIGEFGLIDRITRLLPLSSPNVVVGIGDDVAVLKTSGPEYLLATCDIQVEGIHFVRGAITPYQLGRKAVAINVSDVAAMGGSPSWILVSLAIPEATDVAFIEDLYRGMSEQASWEEI